MASRRMFSIRLINSARFLKMPISSQALYFHLGLMADDDGVVEAYTVIRSVGCTEDDLKVLVAKGFVQVLNEDLVSYITDWTENNSIRSDRKIDSIYKDLLVSVNPDVKLIEKRPRADVLKKKIEMDNQWTTNGQPMDGIGEVSIDKDSIGEVKKPAKETKHKYGEYNNVLLTDTELEKLKAEYPDYEAKIENLSNYIASKGNKYKSHYATIRNWARKDAEQGKAKNSKAQELDNFYNMASEWAESEGNV